MILIDRQMPESCDTCPCMYDFIHCTALRDDAEESLSACDDYTIRQKWCPLKEIVRCKDCKYYHKPEYGFTYGDCTYCSAWRQVSTDDFCSKGRRKDT